MNWEVRTIETYDPVTLRELMPLVGLLRTHLGEAEFLRRVHIQMQEGYRLAYIRDDSEILSFAGFRVCHFLACGRVLYIDDLITHPEHRGYGCAREILTWIDNEAQKLGCQEIHLDSGYLRNDAHRLYMNAGFTLTSHHFSKKL